MWTIVIVDESVAMWDKCIRVMHVIYRVDKEINDNLLSHTTEPQIEESPDLRDETIIIGRK